VTVTLLAGTDEFHFNFCVSLPDFYLCRTEILENRQVSLPAKRAFQLTGYLNATAHDDNVDVVAGTFEEDVAHVTAYDVTFYAKVVGCRADLVKYLLV
jgi:hypothetical protein